MNKISIIAVVLVTALFLIGCAKSTNPGAGYASYNQPQGQPQGGQYVGGGCGVAPNADYGKTQVGNLNSPNSEL